MGSFQLIRKETNMESFISTKGNWPRWELSEASLERWHSEGVQISENLRSGILLNLLQKSRRHVEAFNSQAHALYLLALT